VGRPLDLLLFLFDGGAAPEFIAQAVATDLIEGQTRAGPEDQVFGAQKIIPGKKNVLGLTRRWRHGNDQHHGSQGQNLNAHPFSACKILQHRPPRLARGIGKMVKQRA